jgi:hypothetical protein
VALTKEETMNEQTLEQYLQHLTHNNWHTLRALIEFERDQIESEQQNELAYRAYLSAVNFLTR